MLAERIAGNPGAVERELAEKVGVEHYTIISQLESGWVGYHRRGDIVWANALAVTPMGVRRQAHAQLRPSNLSASLRQGMLQRGSAVALN